jgi:hypothetical protein
MVRLAAATASSGVSTASTTTTGPKVSSWATNASADSRVRLLNCKASLHWIER